MSPDKTKTYRQMALRLAKKGMGITSPNPMVGAVVVKDGRVIGRGYHRGPGKLHAEAVAIRDAGPEAKGATLYINLEPCCHTGKRTPPCTQEIIRSQIRRVVIGMEDPNPMVNGRGIQELAGAGIQIEKGILYPEAVLADDPLLSVRDTGIRGKQPLRIIVDSRLRIPLTARALDQRGGQKTMIVTTKP